MNDMLSKMFNSSENVKAKVAKLSCMTEYLLFLVVNSETFFIFDSCTID